jgi:hypothetical protein
MQLLTLMFAASHPGSATRHTLDAQISAYDLSSTYYPGFKMSVEEGKAMGMMVSKMTSETPDIIPILQHLTPHDTTPHGSALTTWSTESLLAATPT